MDLGLQFLFFFSSLGVFNGLLMSLYFLFFTKNNQLQNTFFGLLILMLTIRIGKSVGHYFIHDLSKIILQVGLSACVFIGPFLYLYLRSVLSQQEKVQRKDLIHIALLGFLTIGVGLVYSYPKSTRFMEPRNSTRNLCNLGNSHFCFCLPLTRSDPITHF